MEESDDDDNDDGKVLLTREERDQQLAIALKKLGNMSRKPLHKYATVDLFARGKLSLGNLAKTRKALIDKRDLKRRTIFQAIKYFRGQMVQRIGNLERCIARSADSTFPYTMPSWKREFKDHMKNRRSAIT